MSKGVDSNLFQLLVAHVDQHIPGDLGIKMLQTIREDSTLIYKQTSPTKAS